MSAATTRQMETTVAVPNAASGAITGMVSTCDTMPPTASIPVTSSGPTPIISPNTMPLASVPDFAPLAPEASTAEIGESNNAPGPVRPRRRAAKRALDTIANIHAWENAPSNSAVVRSVADAIDSEILREKCRRRIIKGPRISGAPLGAVLQQESEDTTQEDTAVDSVRNRQGNNDGHVEGGGEGKEDEESDAEEDEDDCEEDEDDASEEDMEDDDDEEDDEGNLSFVDSDSHAEDSEATWGIQSGEDEEDDYSESEVTTADEEAVTDEEVVTDEKVVTDVEVKAKQEGGA